MLAKQVYSYEATRDIITYQIELNGFIEAVSEICKPWACGDVLISLRSKASWWTVVPREVDENKHWGGRGFFVTRCWQLVYICARESGRAVKLRS